MLTHFSKHITLRAIIAYVLILVVIGLAFYSKALPFQFVLFGCVAVVSFFAFSYKLSVGWENIRPETFVKNLFFIAVLIRIAYVIFVYFYYIHMTGEPHAFQAMDELFYEYVGTLWHDEGFDELFEQLPLYTDISDRGYCVWLSFENLLFGTGALPHRIIKCFIDALTCVLIYHLASRNFGESTGRMAAIFCMLMPNFWYYCGVTLKETEMVFLTVLFVERADYLLRTPKFQIKNLIIPVLVILIMFTFRTALAAVLVIALFVSFIISSGRQLAMWKKVLYSLVFASLLIFTVRVEVMQEIEDLWNGRSGQEANMEWRAESATGNSLARYAGAAVFAPLIFTIPFPTMVDIPGQENQMMLNGANFVKNVMSGFTIFAIFLLLFRKEWRKHVLPLAVMGGYLFVLVFSNFAQSERFHLPALPFELMFAAYGISQLQAKHRTWFNIWLVVICIVNICWAWFKLAGRGLT